ncbi:aminoglycoside 3-N-acetyltransferase [bacterium]|nr:aminoglycoside 3-N-acetyltransferase [bacterium]MBU1917371.1 aminoglycoside 3-N-acetyltransferase [bacterium]
MHSNNKPSITKDQITRELKNLGLIAGHTVMLHSSVKKVGWVAEGPKTIIESILDIITPKGTLVMFASWDENSYGFNEWPKERQEEYLRSNICYNPEQSKADSKQMSILAEILRTWPGAYRSRHPFSYVAVGKKAKWITDNHPWQYRDGKDSPLDKLCQLKGSVLLIGAPLSTVSLLHHAEYHANVPNKRIDRYKMPVLIGDKSEWMEFEEYDTTRGIVDWPRDYFEEIVQGYMKNGHGSLAKIGSADSYLLDAVSLRNYGLKWMEKHFDK